MVYIISRKVNIMKKAIELAIITNLAQLINFCIFVGFFTFTSDVLHQYFSIVSTKKLEANTDKVSKISNAELKRLIISFDAAETI